ncbi:MAG TPA: twin-arginine translocase TatA/TatE family subunit [Solirubrobacteraceae bacterium]|nr:twin-arginine translocase TatA/TatE family subunit [Solirubrobacteraceae bacterium]
MFNQIGLPEVLIVLAIILVIFGPKRLPQLGRSLGGGMREFRDSITGRHKDEGDDDERTELTAAQADEAPTTAKSAPVADEVATDRRG